jgi:hypothetical protein
VTKAVVAIAVVWLVMVAAVSLVQLDAPPVRRVALFVHLVALAVGFGGVIIIDVCGLLWVLGRRTARDMLALAATIHPLISVGLVGLMTSGVVLHPDLASPLARLKLGLVLVIMVNGVYAHDFARRLQTVPQHVAGDNIPWGYVRRGFVTAAVSQVAWWGVTAIGFVTTIVRHG